MVRVRVALGVRVKLADMLRVAVMEGVIEEEAAPA